MTALKQEHKYLLFKLNSLLMEMSEAALKDNEFNEIFTEMNSSKRLFHKSLDEMAMAVDMFVDHFEDEKEFEIIEGQKQLIFNGQVINDIYLSPCLRFTVEPTQYYGLTNEEITELAEKK